MFHIPSRLWLGIFLIACSMLHAQIWIKIDQGEKPVYQAGDSLQLTIQMKTVSETCKDGMRLAKVFVSSLEIVTQDDWKMLKPGFWVKHLKVRMEKSDKGIAKITVQRRVDKEQLFLQKNFDLQGK